MQASASDVQRRRNPKSTNGYVRARCSVPTKAFSSPEEGDGHTLANPREPRILPWPTRGIFLANAYQQVEHRTFRTVDLAEGTLR